ncbi:hypothetical protein D3C83_171540 [compost metagenome]
MPSASTKLMSGATLETGCAEAGSMGMSGCTGGGLTATGSLPALALCSAPFGQPAMDTQISSSALMVTRYFI